EVYGLQLQNLNAVEKRNYPAIDLADFDNRVAFQITATATLPKIKSTLDTFEKYGLHHQFDVLYIFIITERRRDITQEKLSQLIPDGLNFRVEQHIIDRDDILIKLQSVNSITTLEKIAKIFEHEFSDIQIQTRRSKFERGLLSTESEKLFPNLLTITFPSCFYVAEVNIDDQNITDQINSYLKAKGKKPVKR